MSSTANCVLGHIGLRSIARFPVLRGAIREHGSDRRRPWLRFFACEQDLSHDPPDTPLPEAIATGAEHFLIIGAIAGG